MNSQRLHNICIVTPSYPSKNRPAYPFVEQLVEQFAQMGINCSVIAPFSITKSIFRRISFASKYEIKPQKCGSKIEIFRPRHISFSNLKLFRKSITNYLLRNTLSRTLKKLKEKKKNLKTF